MAMKILTSLSIILFVQNVFAINCLENRGSLDIGSGTTKGLVAEVDVCHQKIVKVLFEDRLPLAFNEAMEKNPDQTIPSATVDEAVPKMKALIARMQEQKPTHIFAVATSVFRVAKNGSNVAKALSEKTGVNIEVISQDQEAELGFLSALAQKEIGNVNGVVVWDIGGGSMQMYARDNRQVKIFKGNLASVTFKNEVLKVLKFKSPNDNASPNPLAQDRFSAIQLAKNHAYRNVPEWFKEHAGSSRWIGVGGVLASSIQDQVEKKANEFSQEGLAKTLEERSKLRDDQIQSDYRITDVTNLALVLGYMRALSISKVETVKASLGQGLLLKKMPLTH